MQLAPSERAFWATTVEDPVTPGLVSLCQLDVSPCLPRVASVVAVGASTCSLQLSMVVLESMSSDVTGKGRPPKLLGTPTRPRAVPAIAPNMPPPRFFFFSHFAPAL